MNQFKKNTKFQAIHYLRYILLLFRAKLSGKVWIDRNVRFLRFTKNIELGRGIYIKSNTVICACNKDAKIFLGNNVSIGYNNLIFSSESIIIGNDVMIAPNVHILDSNHGYALNKLMRLQENVTKPVIIEDNVWIGSGSIILAGAHLAEGTIIAANSVVNGSTKKNEIWGGTPANFIKTR